MTRDVVIARTTTPYKELVRLLAEYRIAALPVVDEAGHPVGIVPGTDLTAQQGAELHLEARDGEITLDGRVQTKRQAIRFRELADEAEGVIAVHDRLNFEIDDTREPVPMD